MNTFAILAAGFAYFALGGIWFSPLLFGKPWARAIGFERTPQWKPDARYFFAPLLGCLAAAFATAWILDMARPQDWPEALSIGLAAGFGYGAAITGVNAISPILPRPGLFTAVTGSYHATGLILAATMLHAFR